MASIPAYGAPPDGPRGQETVPPKVILVPVGMPGWEVTFIAAGAAVIAAALAVLAYRSWTARRLAGTPPRSDQLITRSAATTGRR